MSRFVEHFTNPKNPGQVVAEFNPDQEAQTADIECNETLRSALIFVREFCEDAIKVSRKNNFNLELKTALTDQTDHYKPADDLSAQPKTFFDVKLLTPTLALPAAVQPSIESDNPAFMAQQRLIDQLIDPSFTPNTLVQIIGGKIKPNGQGQYGRMPYIEFKSRGAVDRDDFNSSISKTTTLSTPAQLDGSSLSIIRMYPERKYSPHTEEQLEEILRLVAQSIGVHFEESALMDPTRKVIDIRSRMQFPQIASSDKKAA